MDKLLRDLEKYLHETLGLDVKAGTVWSGAHNLPYYLQETFSIHELQLPGLECLLAIPRDKNSASPPATIKKYLQQIQDKCARDVVYLQESISSHNRKRLVEHKVSFVVPGNQLYLPLLGIDFREYFRTTRDTATTISPATQAVILFALNRDIATLYTPLELSRLMKYTPMTMTRVLNELETLGIGEVAMSGKERVLRFTESKAELWDKVIKVARNPIKKRFWTRPPEKDWRCVQAGLTALAHYSLLAEPQQPVYAMSAGNWKSLIQNTGAIQLPSDEPGSCLMEIWSYDPCLFGSNGVADQLSLYLVFKDDDDERVQIAVNEMMAGITW